MNEGGQQNSKCSGKKKENYLWLAGPVGKCSGKA